MTQFERFVGIDVSKDHLDIHCLPDGLQLRIANDCEGIDELVQRLGALDGIAFGCEATGGYEERLLIGLSEAGLPAYCLHPSDVRAFARFKGKRAKTDRLDAKAIAEALAVAVNHRMPVVRTEQQSTIKELTALRRRILIMQNELKSLMSRMSSAAAEAAIATLVATQTALRKQLETAIADAIRGDATLRHRAERLRSVPGTGPVLAAELLGSMPELGSLSSRQAASLVGVAPHPRQSGLTQKRGRCQGGRAQIRRTLYMASLSIIRARNRPLALFYQKLRAAGKPFKVAIVAVMRKLIITLNAIIRTDTPWAQTAQT
ncbi:IS110 family transposase [Phyllobacterium sp. 0TCS1.6C]|uniref:IS110 family transposase n=1 Tax=unclassified Phyllobacterium TaxID=2638441 RepID=UPI0022640AC9|nr:MULTISPECIES: IS110 family transposase [unclassified Phyllobacterium]MCX8282030.1 IS110 family transposase [Phyllobacterium sp. 0TCS1.6C]MCX8296278.1 IS110 family transposase [Phyllobacterium sp. 0TCS1.6A]